MQCDILIYISHETSRNNACFSPSKKEQKVFPNRLPY